MDSATLACWPADTSVALVDLTVADALCAAAEQAPQSTALVEGAVDPEPAGAGPSPSCWRCRSVGRALLGHFAPGERVAVWANNHPERVTLELAAGLAGTVVTESPRRVRRATGLSGRPR